MYGRVSEVLCETNVPGKSSWSENKRKLDAAFTGLRSAAEQGFAEALNFLGRILHYGEGVVQNDKEATHWFMRSAERGHAEAQHIMGV